MQLLDFARLRSAPVCLLLLAGLSAPAYAQEEAYVLPETGVKIQSDEWIASLWMPDSLRAATKDESVILYVWKTTVQAVPTEADLPTYGPVWSVQATNVMGADAATLVGTALDTSIADRPTARGELTVQLGKKSGKLYTAAFACKGGEIHIGTLATDANAKKAKAALDETLTHLEVRVGPEKTDEGGQITGDGVTLTMPPGWRSALPNERSDLAEMAALLPVTTTEGCALALHPRGAGKPDVFASCKTVVLPGVIDELTFDDAELIVRPGVWGEKAKVAKGTMVALPDRNAVEYGTTVRGHSLWLEVAPYDKGVQRMFVIGGEYVAGDPEPSALPTNSDAERLRSDAQAFAKSAEFSGPPFVSGDQFIGYWVGYRTFSPQVLGSGCGCACAGLAGFAAVLGIIGLARRRKPDDDQI